MLVVLNCRVVVVRCYRNNVLRQKKWLRKQRTCNVWIQPFSKVFVFKNRISDVLNIGNRLGRRRFLCMMTGNATDTVFSFRFRRDCYYSQRPFVDIPNHVYSAGGTLRRAVTDEQTTCARDVIKISIGQLFRVRVLYEFARWHDITRTYVRTYRENSWRTRED